MTTKNNNHGISVIGHIVKSGVQILKKDEVESLYNFHINNFLDYFQIHSIVKGFIKNKVFYSILFYSVLL